MATYYIDPVNGKDRPQLPCAANIAPLPPVGSPVKITVTGGATHDMVTGEQVVITAFASTYINGTWTITVIDEYSYTLDGSAWTGSGTTGTQTPIITGGTTWATAWRTLRYHNNIVTGGDEIKVGKTPDPVSIGDATWNNTDRIVGQNNVSSSTNASPIQITCSAVHGLTTGDWVFIYGHNTNTNANGYWQVTVVDTVKFTLNNSTGNGAGSGGYWIYASNRIVTLATPANIAIIDAGKTAWTRNASGDDTIAVTLVATDAKIGAQCIKHTFDAAVQSNIKQAYYPVGAMNLSAFQNISLWIKNSAIMAGNSLVIALCSDANGDTPVDYFDIPYMYVANRWKTYTLARRGGGNLGANINSIALYSGSMGSILNSKYIYLDQIIATMTGDLDFDTYITKNGNPQGGYEGIYGIAGFLSASHVLLDGEANNKSTTLTIGYTGATETVQTYLRKAHIYPPCVQYAYSIVINGLANSLLNIKGGYNPANDTFDGETIFATCGDATLLYYSSRSAYTNYERINIGRCYYGIYGYRVYFLHILQMTYISNCTCGIRFEANPTNCDIGTLNNCTCSQYGVALLGLTTGGIEHAFSISNCDMGIMFGDSNKNIIIGTIDRLNGCTRGIWYTYGMGSIINEIKVANYNYEVINLYGSLYLHILQLGNFNFNSTAISLSSSGGNNGVVFDNIDSMDNCNYGILCGTGNKTKNILFKNIGSLQNAISMAVYISGENVNINSITNMDGCKMIVTYYNAYNCNIYHIGSANNIVTTPITFSGMSISCTIQDAVITPQSAGTLKGVNFDSAAGQNNSLINIDLSAYTAGLTDGTFTEGYGYNATLSFKNLNKVEGANLFYNNKAIVEWQTVEKQGTDPGAWKVTIGDSPLRNSWHPVEFKIAEIVFLGGTQVDLYAWVKKSNATTAGAAIRIPISRAVGITQEIKAIASNTTDWQLLHVSFTPTVDGVIELYGQAYTESGTGNIVYFGSIIPTQA